MDKFIVSARKYRPQTFDTVVGQSHITTTLKNAIRNGQLAHAFLFCGPRGVGKTTCARILAKTINCENLHADGEACNTCRSCTSFNEGTSLNIHELDAASNNSVDDIRSLVDQVRFAPQAGKYKVYIIDEVHMLSSSAFNAFLKTLEEPPPYAIFILATTEKHKILPTILSRCQIFDFKRITISDTVEHLEEITKKEKIKADKPALQVIAQKSEGCMRDALSMLDKIVSFTNGEVNYQHTLEHLNILDADYYFKLIECMLNQDLAGAMLLFDDIMRKGFDEEVVLNDFSEFIRNLLVAKDEKIAGLLDVVDSFREKYISTAKRTDAGFLVSALNILNETEINYKTARNKRLHVELALIRLTYLLQALELAATPEGVAKKKRVEEATPVAFRNIPVIKTSFSSGDKAVEKKEEPKLVIEQPRVEPVPQATEAPPPARVSTKSAQLDKIRKQIAERNSAAENVQPIPLNDELLQKAWNEYTEMLRENKNPAVQSFTMARLNIISDTSFEVITNNNLEHKFVEQEKRTLSEHLQKEFANRSILVTVKITDTPVETAPVEKTLSKKDQFMMMAQEYPLIKELKDKLKLDLDF
ncbi:MAG: DNA polymerase III subunit gamma/tau [Chitinophagaceae bacterium]|nr:DNA polymerase III subunit gamma/tau [Chitinophagaceae bacterium]